MDKITIKAKIRKYGAIAAITIPKEYIGDLKLGDFYWVTIHPESPTAPKDDIEA